MCFICTFTVKHAYNEHTYTWIHAYCEVKIIIYWEKIVESFLDILKCGYKELFFACPGGLL